MQPYSGLLNCCGWQHAELFGSELIAPFALGLHHFPVVVETTQQAA
ncbi:MAG: hypothetical protein WKF58_15245 [Ilumatobacteraceae bacterium]